MEHLTNEEIVRYANIDTLNEENYELSVKVTKHIASCEGCLEKVKKALAVYDVLREIYAIGDMTAEEKAENSASMEQ